MIALLLDEGIPSKPVIGRLRNVRPHVDGPFRTWKAEDRDGRPWRIYRAAGRCDDHYLAARLAARWGARAILHLGTARAVPSWMREEGVESGDVVEPVLVYDWQKLEEVQVLCPNSTGSIPVELPEWFPGAPRSLREESADGLPLASLRLPLTVPYLAERLYRQQGVALFDGGACGVADGGEETGVPVGIAKLVIGPITDTPPRSIPKSGADFLAARAVDAYLDRVSWFENT